MKNLELFDKNGKALHIADVMAMLLPSEEEINTKLDELKANEFEDDEKVAKREYGYGFRRCYFWLKYQRGN
jgi:hypothetical protein